MDNLFSKPVYAGEEPRRGDYQVTDEDRKDPALEGLSDEDIVAAKTPAGDAPSNLFEKPVYEPEEPQPPPEEPKPGMVARGAQYTGHLGYEGLKGMGGATQRAAGALGTILGAFPVALDAFASLGSKHKTTAAQDAWFRTFVDPAVSEETQEYYTPDQDFGSKAANAAGSTLTTISQLVLTGGEAAPAAAASMPVRQVVGQAVEHGVKAMTVPAIAEAVNTGREVYQKTNDANTAVAAASTKYLSTALSGVLPLSAEGGLAARAATGAISGAATGELDRTAQNAVLPGSMQRDFSGEDAALNSMTGAILGGVMGPRAGAKPGRESPLSAIDEAQDAAAAKAKAAGGDTLDQVLAAARAGAEHSEEFAGAYYEHSNQIERARMADEAAVEREKEIFGGLTREEATAELSKRLADLGEKEQAQTAALDDTGAIERAPRTPDEVVTPLATPKDIAFDKAAEGREANKAKDYTEALAQREGEAVQPVPGKKEPLATLADVAPKNLFEKPVHAEPPVNLTETRAARRLRRIEAEQAKAAEPKEPKRLEGPKPTGKFLVDSEGVARPETDADLRSRDAGPPRNALTLRREKLEVARSEVKEVDGRGDSEVKRANGEYAKQLVDEEARHTVERRGPDKEGATPADVVAEANRQAKEQAEQFLRDEAAHEAASSPKNDLPEPTEGQYKAGNFRMGHTTVHDMPVTVEYPKGSKRPYTTAEGVKGEREMPGHYGYFKGTKGADDMHVDVLIGEHPENEQSYVVDHLDTDGKFEQHKVLSGYRNQLDAVRAYKKSYPERKVGSIKEMSPAELKDWLKNGDTTKPLQPEKLGRAADRSEKTQARGSKLRYREGDITIEKNTSGSAADVRIEGPGGRKDGGFLETIAHGDDMQVIHSEVSPGMRGIGHGVRMYEALVRHAAKLGKRVVSDTRVSEQAQRVYDALERRGYTIKRNPAERNAQGELISKSALKPVFEVAGVPEGTQPAKVYPKSLSEARQKRAGMTAEETAATKEALDSLDSLPLRAREADATVDRGKPRTTDQLNRREVHRLEVRKAIKSFNKELPGVEAKVHDTVADAPEHIRAKMEEDGQTDARAVFDPDTGEIHIFADNHASPEDAVVTAVHEGVAHKGLRHLLKDDFEPTMHDVFANAADKKWIADFMDQHGLDPRDKGNRVIAAEEYAASIAERADFDPGTWQRVKDVVRTALRKLKLVKKWTDADIQALLRKSRSGLRDAVPRLREGEDTRLRYASQKDKIRVDDDHPLAIANKIGATVEEQSNYNPGFVRSRLDALRSFGHNSMDKLLAAIPRDKLRDFIAPGKMPSADAYTKQVQKMDGRRNELMVEAEKLGKRWLKYNRKNKENGKTLTELMHAATIAGVEPANTYKPLYSSPKNLEQRTIEAQRKVQHARLRKFWSNLDGEGKALYIDVRDSYAADRDKVIGALEQRIESSDAEGRAKTSLLAELRTQFEKGRVAGPYFPLARFGKHWGVARDAAGDVVSFTRFEKSTERDAWRAEMDKAGYKTDGGQKLESNASMAKTLDPTFVAKITDLLREVDPSIADDVWQHYLRTLPEMSMRKHFIHRQGRLGFTGDAVRAFAYQKFHGAHQIAKLEHMHKLEGHLEQMTVEARKLEEARDKEYKWAVPILEEFKMRHEWARNPKISPLSRALTSLGYLYYMAASPATAFVNLTQTAAVGLPVLAGEFSSAGATAELMRATAQWAGSRGDFGNRLRGDERKAFDEASARGIYEKTQAHDLASIGEEGADFGSVRNQTMEVASFLFHHIERFNREATHIAAYRLGRRKGLTHEAASETAIRLTNDAHFDYSNANRPRYMQNDAARVLLLFRNYAVNMTYRLARDFRNGIIRAGKTEAEKHGALTRFAGMLGATMLQAGVTGMPMWWAAKKVLNTIFGDEDTPFDAEAALYAHLSHQYGETVATAVMHGAVDATTPVTLSSRVGLNNMWVHDAPPNLDGRDEGLFYLQEAAGPVGGLVVKAAQAAALPSQGYADRALETLVPKAAGDVLKAVRYAREGVSDLQGHTLIPPDEVTSQDLFVQAIGFTPSHVTRVQEQNRNIKAAVNKLGDRRQLLINRLFIAAHADDSQGVEEAWAAVREFSEKNPRLAIKGGSIIASAKARSRYSQQAIDGLRVEPNLRYLQEDLRIRDEKETP